MIIYFPKTKWILWQSYLLNTFFMKAEKIYDFVESFSFGRITHCLHVTGHISVFREMYQLGWAWCRCMQLDHYRSNQPQRELAESSSVGTLIVRSRYIAELCQPGHSSKSISFHLSHLLKSTIEWEWVRCMLICINLAWIPRGPTLGLFREGSQVETSAYSLKSRLTKRVKQMQRPPLLLRPSIITTTKYCYWAKVGRVIYRPCQTFKVFTEQNPEITQKEKRQKFQTKARNNSFWIVWLCFYKTEN